MRDDEWTDLEEERAYYDGKCSDLDKERAAHLADLERVEWCVGRRVHVAVTQYYCPVCGKVIGCHAEDCQIAAEIKRLEGE